MRANANQFPGAAPTQTPAEAGGGEPAAVPLPRVAAWLLTLALAYVGVYLCRKNLAVVVPILQSEWQLSKEAVGIVASVGSIAYAAGKVLLGPVVDALGGRRALLASMTLVALFSGLGAAAPSLGLLTLFYGLNRFTAAASWGGIVKLPAGWLPASKLPIAIGFLALSYVFGGALAAALAGTIAAVTQDNWHYVLGVPAAVLLGLVVLCWAALPHRADCRPARRGPGKARSPFSLRTLAELGRERTFLIVCALSFTLNLLRETFSFWVVDFIKADGEAGISSSVAAFLSTAFDLGGGAGILWMGWMIGRVSLRARRPLLLVVMVGLAVMLLVLPAAAQSGRYGLALALGIIGFLAYGPYSLLSGVLAVEVRGQEHAATVIGLVDGVGYVAGVLSGSFFGRLVMMGGYSLGFQCLAALTFLTGLLCLLLYPRPAGPATAASPSTPTGGP